MSKLFDLRVRGGQHHRFDEARDKGWLYPGCELYLVREPDNQFDPAAIQAFVKSEPTRAHEGEPELIKIGYVAGNQCGKLYWRMDRGATVVRCTVTRVDKHAVNASLDLKGGWQAEGQPAGSSKLNEEIPDDDIPF